MNQFILYRRIWTDHHLVTSIVVFLRLVYDLAQILYLRVMIGVLHELLEILQRLLAVGSAVTTLLEVIIAVSREELRTYLLCVACAMTASGADLICTIYGEIVLSLLEAYLFFFFSAV